MSRSRFILTGCSAIIAVGIGLFMYMIPSRSRALLIAEREFGKYCVQERVSRESFQLEEPSRDDEHGWVFDYSSTSTPKHAVRVYVMRGAKTEIHRMRDD